MQVSLHILYPLARIHCFNIILLFMLWITNQRIISQLIKKLLIINTIIHSPVDFLTSTWGQILLNSAWFVIGKLIASTNKWVYFGQLIYAIDTSQAIPRLLWLPLYISTDQRFLPITCRTPAKKFDEFSLNPTSQDWFVRMCIIKIQKQPALTFFYKT